MLFMILFVLAQNDYVKGEGPYELILYSGKYTIRCYGAQGGEGYDNKKITSQGGLGAYVTGTMEITGKGTKFFINVGGKGKSSYIGPNPGGFNGGGSSGKDTAGGSGKDASGGGGGATDIRVYNNETGSRIMVAAGGSGGAWKCNGAPGGDLKGYYASKNNDFQQTNDVTQTAGNSDGIGSKGDNSEYTPVSGGGGGYRGGTAGKTFSDAFQAVNDKNSYRPVSKSGSSYISGHSGCIPEVNVIKFTDTNMVHGQHEEAGLIEIDYVYVCSEYCDTCTSSTHCTKCFDNAFLLNDACCLNCPDGYVGINGYCKPCISPCATCAGSSQLKCTSCIPGYLFYETKCVQMCPNGYVFLNGLCEECTSNCLTCEITVDQCLTCINDFYLFENSCYMDCSKLHELDTQNYFGKNKDEQKCAKCEESNCVSCSENYQQCTQCSELYDIVDGKCIHKQTSVFTDSKQFTHSSHFTSSKLFTESLKFTVSLHFLSTPVLSSSKCFSASSEFTESLSESGSTLVQLITNEESSITEQSATIESTLIFETSNIFQTPSTIIESSSIQEQSILSELDSNSEPSTIIESSSIPVQSILSELDSNSEPAITIELITFPNSSNLSENNETQCFQESSYCSETKEFVKTDDFRSKSLSNSNQRETFFSSIESDLLNIDDQPVLKKKSANVAIIIVIIIGCLVLLVAIVLIFLFVLKREKMNQEENTEPQNFIADMKIEKVTDITQEIQEDDESDLNFWL